MQLTIEKVRQLFAYDPVTGLLTWRQRPFVLASNALIRAGTRDALDVVLGDPTTTVIYASTSKS